jgi:uncharacterized zinc-type alcohol dehydrogenase-like protein
MYPVVVGHEIIGKVRAVGSNVTSMKIDDRVGVGAQASPIRLNYIIRLNCIVETFF